MYITSLVWQLFVSIKLSQVYTKVIDKLKYPSKLEQITNVLLI